jgi:hypothetical protein
MIAPKQKPAFLDARGEPEVVIPLAGVLDEARRNWGWVCGQREAYLSKGGDQGKEQHLR